MVLRHSKLQTLDDFFLEKDRQRMAVRCCQTLQKALTVNGTAHLCLPEAGSTSLENDRLSATFLRAAASYYLHKFGCGFHLIKYLRQCLRIICPYSGFGNPDAGAILLQEGDLKGENEHLTNSLLWFCKAAPCAAMKNESPQIQPANCLLIEQAWGEKRKSDIYLSLPAIACLGSLIALRTCQRSIDVKLPPLPLLSFRDDSVKGAMIEQWLLRQLLSIDQRA